MREKYKVLYKVSTRKPFHEIMRQKMAGGMELMTLTSNDGIGLSQNECKVDVRHALQLRDDLPHDRFLSCHQSRIVIGQCPRVVQIPPLAPLKIVIRVERRQSPPIIAIHAGKENQLDDDAALACLA